MTNTADSQSSLRERFIRTSLLGHAAAVLLLLVVGLLFIEPTGTWTSDEGAIRSQVELLATQGTWSTDRPFADLDPEEVVSPIHASTIVGDRYSPYTKLPALPTTLVLPRLMLGEWALVLPALIGTFVAAIVGALIAGTFSTRIRNLTLWVIAFGSPMFFYGYTVLGHTIAAALGAVALLVVLRSGRRLSIDGLAAASAVFAASLFRPEATAFGLALAVAVLLGTASDRWRVKGLLAGVIAFSAVSGFIVNQWWARFVGGAEPVSEGQGILDGFRFVSGAFSSLILVDFGTPLDLGVVVLMTGGAALLVLSVHREPRNERLHWVLAAMSVAGSVLLVFMTPVSMGGLLAATPVLVAGILLVQRSDFADSPRRMVLITAAVFVASVLVTQERGGGGAQWGGRYLMPVIPILLPLAIFFIGRLLQSIPKAVPSVVVSLAIASLVLTMDATIVLKSGRENSANLTQSLITLAERVDAAEADRPVVMSSRTQIGRHAWRTIGDIDYFLVPEEDLKVYLGRFVESGAERFAFFGARTQELDALFESLGLRVADESAAPFLIVQSIRPIAEAGDV